MFRPTLPAAGAAGSCKVLVPRCPEPGRLEFAAVEDWSALCAGRFGVLEPAASQPALELGAGDLAIVPGLAFDRAGRRLGRGGGYYDRAFPAERSDAPTLVGLAFEFQVVAEVPSACHDRRMDAVCTEAGLMRSVPGDRP